MHFLDFKIRFHISIKRIAKNVENKNNVHNQKYNYL